MKQCLATQRTPPSHFEPLKRHCVSSHCRIAGARSSEDPRSRWLCSHNVYKSRGCLGQLFHFRSRPPHRRQHHGNSKGGNKSSVSVGFRSNGPSAASNHHGKPAQGRQAHRMRSTWATVSLQSWRAAHNLEFPHAPGHAVVSRHFCRGPSSHTPATTRTQQQQESMRHRERSGKTSHGRNSRSRDCNGSRGTT